MNQQESVKTYKITLEPLGKFFFGGEVTFGADQQDTYLVHSRKFPQQTGLLGVLRYELLLQKDLLKLQGRQLQIIDKAKAGKLIGLQSFEFEKSNNFRNYGIIQKLSPLFLERNNISYLPAPFDTGFTFSISSNGKAYTVNEKLLFKLDGYDPKEGYTDKLISRAGLIPYSDEEEDSAFIPDEQVGINKDPQGSADTDAYYKQTCYQLHSGFRFAYYVQLDAGFKLMRKESLVSFGGERRMFKLQLEEISSSSFAQLVQLPTPDMGGRLDKTATDMGIKRIVLLSDAYVSPSIYTNCIFGLTATTPFRYITSHVEKTEWYYNLIEDHARKQKKNSKARRKSKKSTLVKKGSVFYVQPAHLSRVEEELNNYPEMTQIGYNYYQIF